MNILERIYESRTTFQALFEKALAEEESAGAVTSETQAEMRRAMEDREAVVTDLCSWFLREQAKLRGLRAMYDPIREEMEREEKAHENTMEFIKKQIFTVLPPSPSAQVANENCYVYYRESDRVEIFDPALLPSDLREEVVEVRAKTDEVKAALRCGITIPGAMLTKHFSPQIKPGGAAAIKNAKTRLRKLIADERQEENPDTR